MTPEISYRTIQQKLIEFIHIDYKNGINSIALEGTAGKRAKIDAIAGLFPQRTKTDPPLLTIITDDPNDQPFDYLTRIATLHVPSAFTEDRYINKTSEERVTEYCMRNGLPTIAVLFGKERDPHDNHVTDKLVAQLHFVRGANPQEALGQLQTIVQARRAQSN